MAGFPLPPQSELMSLWLACVAWRDKQKPSCPESIVQMDSVNESLPDLAEAVCKVIGYYEEPKAPGCGDPDCWPCQVEAVGCACDGAEDDGCWLCAPDRHERPPCTGKT